ncbi:MAG: nucleotidyltransferase domain-containing protein [Armatimonadetes bacterium]|nr:nucleotidyltransferase domain-containing protein [Armatimonadota bacterium]
MKFGLKESTIEAIQNVFAKYPQVETAILYGSRAMESFRNGSDIDITLVGDALDFSCLLQIELTIDDLLLPYKIDLSIFHQITNPELKEQINQLGVFFYQKRSLMP